MNIEFIYFFNNDLLEKIIIVHIGFKLIYSILPLLSHSRLFLSLLAPLAVEIVFSYIVT